MKYFKKTKKQWIKNILVSWKLKMLNKPWNIQESLIHHASNQITKEFRGWLKMKNYSRNLFPAKISSNKVYVSRLIFLILDWNLVYYCWKHLPESFFAGKKVVRCFSAEVIPPKLFQTKTFKVNVMLIIGCWRYEYLINTVKTL